MELNSPKHIISLSTSAHIVTVDMNIWSATKQDRAISNEVTTSKNADADSGRFTKNLLANSIKHKMLLNYRQTVYNWLQRVTYDWSGSMRLLPMINYEKFMSEYRAHEIKFKELLEEFLTEYPQMISDAAFKQGDMFNRSEYPEVEEVRGKFRIKLFVTDVPAGDFRSSISDVVADDLKKHYERQVTSIIDQVMADASEQLVSIAGRMSAACTETVAGEDGKARRKKIYDTTFAQAKELCTTLKSFNLTNNAALNAACDEITDTLRGVTVEELRESSYARATVKEGIDEMLSKFAPLKFN